MAESFQEKRRRELGLDPAAINTNTDVSNVQGSFQQQRMMDLGMIPDTRPKPTYAETGKKLGISPVPDLSQSPTMQAAKENALLQEPQIVSRKSFRNITAQPTDDRLKMELWRDRIANDPSRDIPVVGPILQTLDTLSANPTVQKIGEIGRELYTPGAGAANVAGLYGAAEAGISRLAPKLASTLSGRAVQSAAKEAIVGAPLAAGQSLASGHSQDIGDAAKQGALWGGVGGAAVGASAPVVSAAFRNAKIGQLLNDFLLRNKTPEPAPQGPTLALPAGRPRGNTNTAQTPDIIYGQGDIHTFELPTPKTIPETLAGIKAETYQRITPPYENPNELAKWVREHLGVENISLNEVRRLPYDDLREMADLMRQRLSARETAVRVAAEQGHDLGELVSGRMVTGQADAPVSDFRVIKPRAGVVKSQPMSDQFPPIQRAEARPISPEDLAKIDFPFENVPKDAGVPLSIIADKPQQPVLANAEDVVQTAAPRIRDRVNDYLDEQIAAAQGRLRAKRNTLSSNPIDQWADYAIIGASYMGKGIVKLADFTEHLVREFGEQIRPHVKDIFNRSKQIYKDTEYQVQKDLQGIADVPLKTLRDLRTDQVYTKDIYRNFEQVFGDKFFPKLKKAILDPFDAAKKQNVDTQEYWLDKLKKEVVDKLGIEKGSKLSALVQRYGEKQIDLVDLKKEAPDDWEKVVEADRWFRDAYNSLIDQVNATRAKIYPSNPDKIVPKRQDYYRHFRELDGFTGLRNLFDTPAQIDPNLVGISEFTNPKSKWASFMQRRGMGPFKNDAVGGFLNYLPSASYSANIDPFIETFRNLGKNIAHETTDSRNMNNFINFLHRFSQDLAGKTNLFDRTLQEGVPGGRKALAAVNWLNSRVKANTILGNAGSALAQTANIPNGVAFAKQYSIPGAGRTLLSIFGKTPEIEQSAFLKERFLDKHYRQFDTRWLDISNPGRLKSFAIWAMETADRIGTEFVWNSAYAKGVAQKVDDPAKYADEWTRKLVAGRGIGEVPLLQKSKIFQLVAPFQLEVANLWRVQKDFVKAKDFGALATLYLGAWVFNKELEQVRGSGGMFDPIQAMIDAYEASSEEFKPIESFGRILGEVLSNVPGGQTIAEWYPEFGTDMYGIQLPTRKELFGKNDPSRFGGGALVIKGAQDPLYKIVPGFGGAQIKKTIQGIQATTKGGAYNGDKLKYPIDVDPLKAAQMALFGPSATSEARTLYDKERRPLSEDQTAKYEKSSNQQQYYDKLVLERERDKIDRQIDDIRKDKKLSNVEKLAKIRTLQEKRKNIGKTG